MDIRLRVVDALLRKYGARAGTMAGWFQQVAGAISALAIIPFAARSLGSASAGVWITLLTFIQFINLADMGLSLVYIRQIAYTFGRKDGGYHNSNFVDSGNGMRGVASVFKSAKKQFRLVSLVCALASIGAWFFYFKGVCVESVSSSEVLWSWILVSAGAAITFQQRPYYILLDGLGKLFFPRFLVGAGQIFSTLLSWLALQQGGGLIVLSVVYFSNALLVFLAFRYIASNLVEMPEEMATEDGAVSRALWLKALPVGAIGIGSVALTQIQVPIVGAKFGLLMVPGFYAAQKIAGFLNVAVIQIVSPHLPPFTTELASGDWCSARRRMTKVVCSVPLIGLVVALAYYALSPWAVRLIAHGAVIDSRVLAIFAFDIFLYSGSVAWGHFVLASGNNVLLYSGVIAGVINVVILSMGSDNVDLWFIPLVSLACATVFSYSACIGWGVRLLSRLKEA